MDGIYTGLLDIYYSVASGTDSSVAALTYGTPAILGYGIEVTVTPRYKEGKLYASNRAIRDKKLIDGYDVTLNPDNIAAAVRKELLGRKVDVKGVHVIDGDQVSPNVAIGFELTRDDGTSERWWLLKGAFSEMEVSGKTEGENIEYQTPKLSASFNRRINDNQLAYIADSADEDMDETTFAGWFSGVYAPTWPTPPDPDDDN